MGLSLVNIVVVMFILYLYTNNYQQQFEGFRLSRQPQNYNNCQHIVVVMQFYMSMLSCPKTCSSETLHYKCKN